MLIETGEKAEVSQKNHIVQSMSGILKRLTLSELESYKRPVYVEEDLETAIRMICRREKFSIGV